jgi:hypothetical protein
MQMTEALDPDETSPMTDISWLPNFFIAGAPKAGTSSVHGWIAAHPDAFGSVEKETYFFVDPGTHMYRPDFHVANGLMTFKKQFPIPEGEKPKIIVESTPSYIYNRCALDRIPELPSTPKCLFLLREPSAQIYSLYTYFRDNWSWIPPEMTFAEFIAAATAETHSFKGNELAQRAIRYARYAEHLEPWAEQLGPDRMMVALFDDLAADNKGFTQRVAQWLGLDPAFYDSYAFPRENETYAPKSRVLQNINVAVRGMLPKGRAYEAMRDMYRRMNTQKPEGPQAGDAALLADLRSQYVPHNEKLAKMFDLDISAWR